MPYRVLRALMMLLATHAPFCSLGDTPLDVAIKNNSIHAAAFLRSVCSPEKALLRDTTA
jgi:hypothetical protein